MNDRYFNKITKGLYVKQFENLFNLVSKLAWKIFQTSLRESVGRVKIW